jgi:hypothetical protein
MTIGSFVFPDLFLQKIGVATFVNEPQHAEGVAFKMVVEQEGERAAAAAGETVGTDVIAALPAHHGPYRRLYPHRKILSQPRRNFCVAFRLS